MNLDDFTHKYQLSKTLRFELKLIGDDGKQLSSEDALKALQKIIEEDQKIKAAYTALKPVMDKIHEELINVSLTSDEAKKIDFSEYFNEYREKRNELQKIENKLRNQICSTFNVGIGEIIGKSGTDNKGKPIFKKKNTDCLTEAGILKYLNKNLNALIPDEEERKGIENHLKKVSKFFMYFDGYNHNRENYYENDGKKTAVATRIVDENLPKFMDNCIQFSDSKTRKNKNSNERLNSLSRKEEYLNAYQYLITANRTTQIKDAATQEMITAYPVDESMFSIEKFSDCLSQGGIEEYNRITGHYNLLINLYNQARKGEAGFRKLEQFKTLYKQIGCGEKKEWLKALKYETEQEQHVKEKENEDILSVQGVLKLTAGAAGKYFVRQSNDDIVTVYKIIDWLKATENWDGIYWSKTAVDKVSNRYFANWYELKDQLKGNKACVTYDKKREEPLKINDAVELSGLFEVLDREGQSAGWPDSFFKASVLEERKSMIVETISPSRNLVNLICQDITDYAEQFCSQTNDILSITDYKNEDNILKIKHWFDVAKEITWLIKYFEVKINKVKGNSINAELSNMLDAILRAKDAEWYDWYDLIRNYLTKKPQDDAKKNKLKLNFNNPVLADGWSDGQEKTKGTVLLKNGDKYYLGLLMKRSLFDTSKDKNPIYQASDGNTGRLILKTLKFQTLAGKGFVRDYGEKYGEISERNPQDAIQKLKSFIGKHYVNKYPLLKQVIDKQYSDKKLFDKEIQKLLTDCYECNFKPVDWNRILEHVGQTDLYLFEIYNKDFGQKSTGKPNLHTLYWRHIFDADSTIQLCANGELFYREKAIESKVTHDANKPIDRRGARRIFHNGKNTHEANKPIDLEGDGQTKSRFSHDIVKDKRFTTGKFFFHVPVKINYQSPVRTTINEDVNNAFTQDDNIRFLGIDRGEKHLIYYSLVDAKDNLIEQGHFDNINGKDYLKAIKDAADIRRKKQENWQQKGNISNLKDGYMSLVVHEVIKKLKDSQSGEFKTTFIVMEDLNTGFKRSRQKFEQQVYQKFELALAKKLNYLVDKDAPMDELGSIAKALQLTPLVSNYKDIENKKQVGIMLYTRANYTSVTDPATGWRKTIYLKPGSEADIKRQILEKFDEIGIDANGDYFFQYIDDNTGKFLTLWSGKNGKSLERYRTRRGRDRNEIIIDSYNLKKMLDDLFKGFDKSVSLSAQLKEGKALSKIDNKNTSWESLRFVIDLIQQIRNSGDISKHQDDNFLLSPVRNDTGEHFDSRNAPVRLPKDADANGAYNIARKGILMYEHIKQWIKDGKKKFEKGSDLDLFVSDKEWDLWLSDKLKWKEQLSVFASRQLKSKQQKLEPETV